MDTSDLKYLGILSLDEAKRVRAALSEQHVEITLHNNPETCAAKNCAPRVEVYYREVDLGRITEFFAKEKARLFDGLEVDEKAIGQVFDTEKETAICPACTTEFSTRLGECPDCGLVFTAEQNPE